MQIFGQNSPQVTTEAVVTKLSDAPVMVDTTDNDSTATEVSRGTDSVENVPTPSGSPTAVQPFKLAIPEPLEKASQTALIAVQLWWDQMMPLLQKLQAQILLQLDPYVKASAERFAQLQAEIAPHTEPARKLLTEWNAKLEPHAKAAMESVETARQAVMAKAYEPALVAIQQASVAVQKHAETTAALVSSKAAVGFEASKVRTRARALRDGASASPIFPRFACSHRLPLIDRVRRLGERATPPDYLLITF